ncbi:MAG: FMN-binding glutamate synthase family protein [Candidatus Schekmanbacteria bacterium]|nr:MAG: FMN-binding glutamate synthase family protein [Candidatus Schekmanbacteria bacterium]
MRKSYLIPEFRVEIDHTRCRRCKRCIMNCSYEALSFSDRVVADHFKCVACHRCIVFCPENVITVRKNPVDFKESFNWTNRHRLDIWKQAETGGIPLTGMGNDLPYQIIWDHLVLDACQVTNPSIDPLREPMELRTYLGKKPDSLQFEETADGKIKLKEKPPKNIKLEMPVVFSPMSYGSISLNAHKAMAMTAKEMGIVMHTGEGGLHKDLYDYSDYMIVQCASGRFGVHAEYLKRGIAVDIKIGQGAKPGIGGHLPGEKVGLDISKTRMIPIGTDALSPAPHHDIYSIEDLRQLIYAIKEATNYKPVSVKIATVHNVAAIVSGIVRAGADIVYLDGFRGGTGASPKIVRDHVGIPLELALAAVDDRLREEGIRNQASIIAAGSIRSSADAIKAIALGADAVAIGTAALVAIGCRVCQTCHMGKCAWGIATQRPELARRLDPEIAAERLINMLKAWKFEIKEVLGSLGLNAIESLRGSRERLRGIGLDAQTLDILGVKPAGK